MVNDLKKKKTFICKIKKVNGTDTIRFWLMGKGDPEVGQIKWNIILLL